MGEKINKDKVVIMMQEHELKDDKRFGRIEVALAEIKAQNRLFIILVPVFIAVIDIVLKFVRVV